MHIEPTSRISLIGFDGDDTLWHHGRIFVAAQKKIGSIVARYASIEEWDKAVSMAEVENIQFFGYGVKSYILSLIEVAVKVSRGRITAHELVEFVTVAKHMIEHDIEIMSGAPETLSAMQNIAPLVLITKGERSEQLRKAQKSKLTHYFSAIEVVHDKTAEIYTEVLMRHGCKPDQFVMIGNSLRSDIVPTLQIGAWAIHVPHEIVWHHELVPRVPPSPRLRVVSALEDIAPLFRTNDRPAPG